MRKLTGQEMERLGKRLKNAREKRALSTKDVHKMIDTLLSVKDLTAYENGKVMMGGITMLRFCRLYGLDIRAFFSEDYDGRFDTCANEDVNEKDECLRNKFRRNIHNLRYELKYTQAEFGKRTGLRYSSFSYYEAGKRIPSSYALYRICMAANVSIFDLFK